MLSTIVGALGAVAVTIVAELFGWGFHDVAVRIGDRVRDRFASECLRSVGRVVSYLLIVAALAGVVLRGTALFDRVS